MSKSSCKPCSRCKEEKPLTEFGKQSKTHDSLRPECKSCGRADSKKYSRPIQQVVLTEKYCRRCDTTKPASEFFNNIRHTDRLSTYCKTCTKAIRPDYSKDQQRDFRYKSSFGITLDDYNRMLREQGGKCAICETSKPGNGKVEHFSVDHCHATGVVRGLLCERCNRGLGHYDDHPERLEAAANYLRKHQDGRRD